MTSHRQAFKPKTWLFLGLWVTFFQPINNTIALPALQLLQLYFFITAFLRRKIKLITAYFFIVS